MLTDKDLARLGSSAKRQIIEKMSQANAKKAGKMSHNKYNAVKTTVNGIKFDSKKEAARYEELIVLSDSGIIKNFKLQPQFTLQEGYKTPSGKAVRALKYVADFSYTDESGKLVVEDVKSRATATRVYQMKKKLLLERFGVEVKEV